MYTETPPGPGNNCALTRNWAPRHLPQTCCPGLSSQLLISSWPHHSSQTSAVNGLNRRAASPCSQRPPPRPGKPLHLSSPLMQEYLCWAREVGGARVHFENSIFGWYLHTGPRRERSEDSWKAWIRGAILCSWTARIHFKMEIHLKIIYELNPKLIKTPSRVFHSSWQADPKMNKEAKIHNSQGNF